MIIINTETNIDTIITVTQKSESESWWHSHITEIYSYYNNAKAADAMTIKLNYIHHNI